MKKLLIVGSIILGSIGFSTSAFAQLKSESETKNKVIDTPKISYEQAKEIALKESKNGKFKEIELKNKKGTLVYVVELNEGLMEIEFIIDANTGEILKNKKGF